MIIAVPSKGRAGKVKTQSILKNCRVYVPALEAKSYRDSGVRNVVPVPDEVRGITRTRNWILNNTDDPHVVMVDDDVKCAGWVRMSDHTCKHVKLKVEDWEAEMERLFQVTEDMNFRIWGMSTESAPRSVYTFNPFRWRSYITASMMGILNDGRTRFDQSFPVKEGYELNLRCIKEDGGVVCARYLYWENDHWHGDGGCKDYRSDRMERECIRKLQRLYPGMIRVAKRANSPWTVELVQ